MAQCYVLDVNPVTRRARIAMHVQAPNGNNSMGVPYDKALRDYGTSYNVDKITKVLPRSAAPWLEEVDPQAWQSVMDGEVYETIQWVDYDPAQPPEQNKQAIKTQMLQMEPGIIEDIKLRLQYYGGKVTTY